MSVWNEIPGQAGYDGNVKPERMTEFYQGTMRARKDGKVKLEMTTVFYHVDRG